jgi:hypothetical protein
MQMSGTRTTPTLTCADWKGQDPTGPETDSERDVYAEAMI